MAGVHEPSLWLANTQGIGRQRLVRLAVGSGSSIDEPNHGDSRTVFDDSICIYSRRDLTFNRPIRYVVEWSGTGVGRLSSGQSQTLSFAWSKDVLI